MILQTFCFPCEKEEKIWSHIKVYNFIISVKGPVFPVSVTYDGQISAACTSKTAETMQSHWKSLFARPFLRLSFTILSLMSSLNLKFQLFYQKMFQESSVRFYKLERVNIVLLSNRSNLFISERCLFFISTFHRYTIHHSPIVLSL